MSARVGPPACKYAHVWLRGHRWRQELDRKLLPPPGAQGRLQGTREVLPITLWGWRRPRMHAVTHRRWTIKRRGWAKGRSQEVGDFHSAEQVPKQALISWGTEVNACLADLRLNACRVSAQSGAAAAEGGMFAAACAEESYRGKLSVSFVYACSTVAPRGKDRLVTRRITAPSGGEYVSYINESMTPAFIWSVELKAARKMREIDR